MARRRHPIARLVAARLGMAVLTLVAVSVLVFAATEVVPGDAARAVAGKGATPQRVAELRAQMRLDDPAPVRYARWLSGVGHGDLGRSLTSPSQRPVGEIIGRPLANSALLGGIAALLLVPLSIGLGVAAAHRASGRLDRVVSSTTLALNAMPVFVVGAVLIIMFSVWGAVLPADSLIPLGRSPLARPEILVLPVLTLLAVSLAQNVRLLRASLIEVLDSDFVEAARLNGIPERRVVWRYALPSAIGPAAAQLAVYISGLVGGAIVVEVLFGYGGIGPVFISAVSARDMTVVQGIALIVAALTVLANLAADVVTIALVPKLRRPVAGTR